MEMENIAAVSHNEVQKVEILSVTGQDATERTVAQGSAITVSKDTEETQNPQENSKSGPDKALEKALEEVNKKLKPAKKRAEFSYYEPTNSISIKILDEETNEVIREVPSEDRLKLAEKMMKMAGLILDETC